MPSNAIGPPGSRPPAPPPASAQSFAHDVCHALGPVLNAGRAVFADRWCAGPGVQPADPVVHFVNWPAWCEAHYREHEWQSDPIAHWLDSGHALDDGGVALLSDLVPTRVLERAPYFERMLRPTGARFVLTLALPLEGQVAAALSLVRDESAQDFTPRECELARSMLPLMSLAYQGMKARGTAFGPGLPSGDSPLGALTAREREIAQWAAQGHSNKAIARLAGNSPWTVKNQLRAIFEKTGVHSRAALGALLRAP